MKPALSLVDPDNLLTRAATVPGNSIIVHRSPGRPNESWKWEATDPREIERGATLGGWKASDVGPAEHGSSNREFFTRAQSIYFS